LEFLPHHFLLCSIGEQGVLRYQDVTHGALVAQHRTKLGACEVMRHNPQNAIVHCGHGNGTVTLWSPNAGHAQVKMLCHRGPIRRVFFSSRRSPYDRVRVVHAVP
jgi:U3 small nucleolar RNA-associated protein 7